MRAESKIVPSRWSKYRRSFVSLGIVYLGVCLLLAWLQRSLMYQPRKGPVPISAADQWAPHLRECQVTAGDGTLLHGWLSLCDADSEVGRSRPLSDLHHENRLLVVMFAGNAGNRLSRLSQLSLYNGVGCNALLVDYRGYGENSGNPSEAALCSDARCVWDFAVRDLKVPADRIVISGESLGGGVATALASEVCREGMTPAGLILRATFSSMVDAASHNYWWLPVRLVLLDRYPSAERISHVDCPVLCYHGDQDEIVPLSLGQQLFHAAPEQAKNGVKKRFLEIKGAGHNDIFKVGSQEIAAAIENFLQEVKENPDEVPPPTNNAR